MRNNCGAALGIVLALCGAVAFAQGAPRETGAGGSLPGPNATPPAAQDHSADASNAIQPVPGAMRGSDAVPSTLSEKNAADDKLITVAYTFKNLTADQRQAIFEALKDKSAGSAFNADVGIELPSKIEIHTMPDEVVGRVPQTAGYAYAIADNRVLVVSPANRVVVGIFPDVAGVTAGQGRRPEQ